MRRVSVVALVLVTYTFCVLVLLTSTDPKLMGLGEIVGPAGTPVPLKVAVAAPFVASLVTVRVPDEAPSLVGEKTTATEQEIPALRMLGQLLNAITNGEEATTEAMFKSAVPVLVSKKV